MLITELKSTETLRGLIKGKVFVLNCHGCREIRFPEAEANAFQAELTAEGVVTGIFTTEYICNDENLAVILKPHAAAIEAADTIAVFSCGVGVQTVAAMYPAKRVVACCDTYALPGYQGVTPLEHDCKQCGECYLNLTGGICPITACTKSLLNGPCGGARNGMCEADPRMECGWERIRTRLEKLGRSDVLRSPVQIRDYRTDQED